MIKRFFLILFAILICSSSKVFADHSGLASPGESESVLPIALKNINVWADGALVEMAYDDGETKCTINTPDEDSDVYHTYIYKAGKFDWTGYSEIAVDIHNTGQEALRLNFIATDSAGKDYTLDPLDSVIAIQEGDPVVELLSPPEFGLMELPSDFKGEIHISIENIGRESLQNIVSYGITLDTPKNKTNAFTLSKVKLIPENSLLSTKNIPKFQIVGDSAVQRPIVGKSIAAYTAVLKSDLPDRDVKFSIEESNGIFITEKGKLIINEEAKAVGLTIKALLNGNIQRTMEITLIDSWAKDKFLGDGTKLHIPRPDEMIMLVKDKSLLLNTTILDTVRVVFSTLAFVICTLYLCWRDDMRGGFVWRKRI